MDDFPDTIPDQIVVNGINAKSKKFEYSVTVQAADIRNTLLSVASGLPDEKQRDALDVRASGEPAFSIMIGKDANNLADSGWALVFPAQTELPVAAIKEAMSDLLTLRKEQAGPLFHIYEGEDGLLPNESAAAFMERHGSSPGTQDPTPEVLPYYLLLVGSPQEMPFVFQYELDATFLVGRIYFGVDPNLYHQYARSVYKAEVEGLKLARRAVFFGSRHEGDPATEASSEMLVKGLADRIDQRFNKAALPWDVQYLEPQLCLRSRLETLLGRSDASQGFPKGDTPAFLFTATHGMVYPSGDPEQAGLQGSLLCQDLATAQDELKREYYLGAEDVTDDFCLHGLVAFMFACFGAGTPLLDHFAKPGQTPSQIAPADFLSALPQRLLTHPRGGALAVVGHIDRAWTYSFKWKQAGPQTQTFEATLAGLLAGQRLGNVLDQFNMRYSQLATRVSNWYDPSLLKKPTTAELLRDWTSNNDARGYALMGDPAVKLAVAGKDESEAEHACLPVEIFTPKPGGEGAFAALPKDQAASQAGSDQPAAQTGSTKTTPVPPPAPENVIQKTDAADQMPATGAPLVIYNSNGGIINLSAGLVRRAGAAAGAPGGESDFAGIVGITNSERPAGGGAAQAGGEDALATTRNKLAGFLESLGNKLDEFTSLEVNTYVSSDLAKVAPVNGKLEGPDLQPRAKTLMHLNGNTEIVVPNDEAGGIDNDLWQIHKETFTQAQAWRESLVKSIANLVTGFFPAK